MAFLNIQDFKRFHLVPCPFSYAFNYVWSLAGPCRFSHEKSIIHLTHLNKLLLIGIKSFKKLLEMFITCINGFLKNYQRLQIRAFHLQSLLIIKWGASSAWVGMDRMTIGKTQPTLNYCRAHPVSRCSTKSLYYRFLLYQKCYFISHNLITYLIKLFNNLLYPIYYLVYLISRFRPRPALMRPIPSISGYQEIVQNNIWKLK